MEEFSESLTESAGQIFELRIRVGRAESDEEREAAEAELATFQENRNASVRSRLEEILDEEQLQRLDQFVLHRSGPPALAREDVAEKLGLDENQQLAIASMIEQRGEAMRGGFRMSREMIQIVGI